MKPSPLTTLGESHHNARNLGIVSVETVIRILAALILPSLLMCQPGTDRNQPGPWKRHVMTPKDAWFDTPPPYPLAHFTRYPALLDETGEFCYLCPPQKKLAAAKAAKEPKAEVDPIGTIKGLQIYDVFYRFESEGAVIGNRS